ncbi:hypothetical protein XELAEV_18028401mg [Xenopus laevis]|uniref:Uncharacterized protein n=1 Tax=Xenopus laevis TaxID=8355 RepID=A0A974CY63_XENLA|nr:hypothetical protein XELAEV_18028401mg [Xenopus laevis]
MGTQWLNISSLYKKLCASLRYATWVLSHNMVCIPFTSIYTIHLPTEQASAHPCVHDEADGNYLFVMKQFFGDICFCAGNEKERRQIPPPANEPMMPVSVNRAH